MLRSYWSKIAKIAGLALLLFAAYGLFSVLSWHSAAFENDAANRSDIHRQNANDRIVSICPATPTETDCISQAQQAARANERDEQDLAAQKVTAWWTKIMGISALIGMALSGVGVWWVKSTFDEARDSNKIAKRALELEHRPAMVPHVHTAEVLYVGKVGINANFRNASKATIRVVSVKTDKQPDTNMPRTEQYFENLGFLTPDETLEIQLGSFNDQDWQRRIDVAIQYHAVNSPTIYQTDATASVSMLKNQSGQTSPELRWIALTVSEKPGGP